MKAGAVNTLLQALDFSTAAHSRLAYGELAYCAPKLNVQLFCLYLAKSIH